MKKFLLGLMAVVVVTGVAMGVMAEPVAASTGECTSILGDELCGGEYGGSDDGQGIVNLLIIVLNILTGGVGILATIGLVVSGIQYMMARDDAGKVAKVKSRIFNIVLGLLAYGVMWVALQWLIPGGFLNGSSSTGSTSENSPEEANRTGGGGGGNWGAGTEREF